MSESLARQLDLELAWRRVEIDRQDSRRFVTHPYLFQWIERDANGWLTRLNQQLVAGYHPASAQLCVVPKGGWMTRPGTVLQIEDDVIYTALVGAILPRVIDRLAWSQGVPDVACQLQINAGIPKWIRNRFDGWTEFREASLRLLTENVQYVVVSDIAGFYENIDLGRLSSDVRSLDVDGEVFDLLMACLNRWAQPRGKGIPQGHSASDILAKLYMTVLDETLRDNGIIQIRYLDDLRIFCSSRVEAKKALLCLEETLRNRGLNLQSAKTRILTVQEARDEIDGIAPIVGRIDADLRDEIEAELPAIHGYGTLQQIDQMQRIGGPVHRLEVIERAFREHFLAGDRAFNKTLFHYLIKRLAKNGSPIATDYCVRTLTDRPEETSAALDYLKQVDVARATLASVIEYAGSEEAIYDYQLYEIVQWLHELKTNEPSVLNLCRRVAWDYNRPVWLRSYAVAMLGEFGNAADLERAEAEYPRMPSELEKADCVHCVRRMEVGRRNALYGRVVADGDLIRRARDHARGMH